MVQDLWMNLTPALHQQTGSQAGVLISVKLILKNKKKSLRNERKKGFEWNAPRQGLSKAWGGKTKANWAKECEFDKSSHPVRSLFQPVITPPSPC